MKKEIIIYNDEQLKQFSNGLGTYDFRAYKKVVLKLNFDKPNVDIVARDLEAEYIRCCVIECVNLTCNFITCHKADLVCVTASTIYAGAIYAHDINADYLHVDGIEADNINTVALVADCVKAFAEINSTDKIEISSSLEAHHIKTTFLKSRDFNIFQSLEAECIAYLNDEENEAKECDSSMINEDITKCDNILYLDIDDYEDINFDNYNLYIKKEVE